MEASPAKRRRSASSSNNETFPTRLYAMLQEAESQCFASIVRWVDDRYFRVFDPDRFEAEVLGRYFESTKFNSFRRQLNLYGFECIREKRHRRRGCYSHPRFRRDCPPDNFPVAKKAPKRRPPPQESSLDPRLEFPLNDDRASWLADTFELGSLSPTPTPTLQEDLLELHLYGIEQQPAIAQGRLEIKSPVNQEEFGFLPSSSHPRAPTEKIEHDSSKPIDKLEHDSSKPIDKLEHDSSTPTEKHEQDSSSDQIFSEWLCSVPLDIQDEILFTFLKESKTSPR